MYRPIGPTLLMALGVCIMSLSMTTQACSGERETSDIEHTIQNWAVAWSQQDVNAYLSHYSVDFTSGVHQDAETWQNVRRERLTVPGFIQVDIRNLEIDPIGNSRAAVSFVQTYRSDRYSSESVKDLAMVRLENGWKIEREIVHREYLLASRQRERDGFLLRWAERDHKESMGEAYEKVQAAIRGSWTEIQMAYEEITRSDPMLYGEMALWLKVDAGLAEVAFSEDSVNSPELREVIRRKVAAWNLADVISASFSVTLPFKSTLRVSAQ